MNNLCVSPSFICTTDVPYLIGSEHNLCKYIYTYRQQELQECLLIFNNMKRDAFNN